MRVLISLSATLLLTSSLAAFAQDTTTASCKDGTSWSGARRAGACRGHGGVQAFGGASTASAPSAVQPMPAATTSPAATTAPVPTSAPSATARPAATAALGAGGVGQVWVNSATKIYHCQGDRSYGKTKAGEYMTEAAAKAAGDRPSRGKACS